MKTVFYGLLTMVFSGGAMMAGLNSNNMWIGYGVALLAWVLFFWDWNRRGKKASERKFREQKFQLYMRRAQKPY